MPYECCVLSGRGLCDGLITRPTECGVSECDREAMIIRMPWPIGGGLLYHGGVQLHSFLTSAVDVREWRALHPVCLTQWKEPPVTF